MSIANGAQLNGASMVFNHSAFKCRSCRSSFQEQSYSIQSFPSLTQLHLQNIMVQVNEEIQFALSPVSIVPSQSESSFISRCFHEKEQLSQWASFFFQYTQKARNKWQLDAAFYYILVYIYSIYIILFSLWTF